jgi:hypothetical protein
MSMPAKPAFSCLTRDFFHRPTVLVAQELLGKTLVFNGQRGRITETEAYLGQADDPACHAARGKTKRNAVMFGQAGLSYVYFIYGMYYCFNIVTEDEHFGAAVLIRGVLEDSGRHLMARVNSVANGVLICPITAAIWSVALTFICLIRQPLPTLLLARVSASARAWINTGAFWPKSNRLCIYFNAF